MSALQLRKRKVREVPSKESSDGWPADPTALAAAAAAAVVTKPSSPSPPLLLSLDFPTLQPLYQATIQTYGSPAHGVVATVSHGVAVFPSMIPTAGYGLFTTQAFPKGAVITGFEGVLLSRATAEGCRQAGQQSHIRTLLSQFLYVDGLRQIPAPEGCGGASYANDAGAYVPEILALRRVISAEEATAAVTHLREQKLTNNAEFWTVTTRSGALPLCFLRAKEDMLPGAEVFVSYGRQYWGTMAEQLLQQQPQNQQQKQQQQQEQQQQPSNVPGPIPTTSKRRK